MLCLRGRAGVPPLGVRGLARKMQEAAPHMAAPHHRGQQEEGESSGL